MMIKSSKPGVVNEQAIAWSRFMKLVPVILLMVGFTPSAIASNMFRADDRVFITNLKPQTKVAVNLQRITFRKIIADDCGEVGFNATAVPDLVIVESREFIPAKFPLEANRICSKGTPVSERSYKVSATRFIIAGLKPKQPYLIRIIRPSKATLNSNRCGYGTITITQSLTPFAGTYADNIYAINGRKLANLPTKSPLICRRSGKAS